MKAMGSSTFDGRGGKSDGSRPEPGGGVKPGGRAVGGPSSRTASPITEVVRTKRKTARESEKNMVIGFE